jgi:hypothetical protein
VAGRATPPFFVDMAPTRRTLALLTLAATAAWMLAVLQADVTNVTDYSASIVRDYADGTIGDHWTDGVPAVIWKARLLVRGLILALTAVAPRLTVETANVCVQAGFVLAALVVIYRATALLATPAGALFASAVAVAAVPWGFLSVGFRISYPYDLPTIFFSAAGLAAILSRRFVLLAAVVAIGTLNKETTVYLLAAYVLAEWRTESGRVLLTRALILAAIFAVAYEVPRLLLQSAQPMLVTVHTASGDAAGSRVWSNLKHLLEGEPGGFIQSVWWVAMLHVPAMLYWRRLPRALRAAYIATPLFIVPLWFFGNIYELRLYNELIPLGAMACAAALVTPDAPQRVRPDAYPRHGTKSAR